MKYGIRAEGQFFICPLCPLFKSFATAGLDPLIHLQKKGRQLAADVLSKEAGKSFDIASIDNWWRNHKKKGKTAS